MFEDDPFTCFLMNWTANWKLVYKNKDELKQIFQNAGYKWKTSSQEKYGYHIIGKGVLE